MADKTKEFIDKLSSEISNDVGNIHEDELEQISSSFDKTLSDALKAFNSSTFDDDGFIKKIREMDLGDKKDKDIVKNVLNNLKNEFIDVQSINHSELLLRRDMYNICTQMPEMRDVIYVVRDSIIECNVATGEVSRSITFENHQESETYESQAKEIEQRHDLLMAIKNFIVPNTLMSGETYVHVVPYSKLFAELEAMNQFKYDGGMSRPIQGPEFAPESVNSLYSEENLNYMMESVSTPTKIDSSDSYKIEKSHNGSAIRTDYISKEYMSLLLKNINICNQSSVLMEEMGVDGIKELYKREIKSDKTKKRQNHFLENLRTDGKSVLGRIPDDEIPLEKYSKVKGCYIKYLDGLRIVPIRMDRRVIGYYYISTTMDLQVNPAQPNGIVDLSFQHYTRDKNLVDNLASLIMRSFDKKMLDKNIRLKNEIAEVIMAHRFSEGKLSFIFIPENEVVRMIINEDENGKGHSIIEPTIFPARMYLMLTLYNMIYILNNNTTRVHYLRSSGLNKDYAAQIQRTMRKFQSRRITVDDIYSYTGVLNKVGGIGEMILPTGRGDYKALETETIPAADNPISMEFLEQQRRQALSGTGVPYLMATNIFDDVDFAKTMEMANTRFLSTVSAYKIDFNSGLTRLYQLIMKHSTDLEDDVIQSFRFQFNAIKQKTLDITNDMMNNFNTLVEMVGSIYYKPEDIQDKDGKPSIKMMHLKKELAKEYLPQLDFDNLEEIIKKVELSATEIELQDRVSSANITPDDVEEISEEEPEE